MRVARGIHTCYSAYKAECCCRVCSSTYSYRSSINSKYLNNSTLGSLRPGAGHHLDACFVCGQLAKPSVNVVYVGVVLIVGIIQKIYRTLLNPVIAVIMMLVLRVATRCKVVDNVGSTCRARGCCGHHDEWVKPELAMRR